MSFITKDFREYYKLIYETGIYPESRTFTINSEIDDDTLERVRCAFQILKGGPITCIINSPGGDVVVGMAIIAYFNKYTKETGYPVDVVVDGMAASMACVIMQGATGRRIARPDAVMMHHVGSIAINSDHFTNVKHLVKFQEKYAKRINDLMLRRVNEKRAQQVDKNGEPLKPRTESWWEERDQLDRWMDAEEALELGLIDEISL